jgi:hypothetical protein
MQNSIKSIGDKTQIVCNCISIFINQADVLFEKENISFDNTDRSKGVATCDGKFVAFGNNVEVTNNEFWLETISNPEDFLECPD